MLYHVLARPLHCCHKKFHTAKTRGNVDTEQFRNPFYNHLHVNLLAALLYNTKTDQMMGYSGFPRQCLGRNAFTIVIA